MIGSGLLPAILSNYSDTCVAEKLSHSRKAKPQPNEPADYSTLSGKMTSSRHIRRVFLIDRKCHRSCLKMLNLVARMFAIALCMISAARACADDRNLRILTIGDSLMAWNSIGNGSVADALSLITGTDVVDRSVVASFLLTGGIDRQYLEGDWDWVVTNGGGNDLWLGCGCRRCENSMNTMISPDGKSGRIADLLLRARAGGAKVIYVGYLRSPGINTPIEHCKADGNELERRIELFTNSYPDIYFVSLTDLVPFGARNYLSFDRIHPSRVTSFLIAERISELIEAQSRR